MADDLRNKDAQDRARIDIRSDRDRRYWSKKFAVSEKQLMKAMEAVGTSAEAVARHLGKAGAGNDDA